MMENKSWRRVEWWASMVATHPVFMQRGRSDIWIRPDKPPAHSWSCWMSIQTVGHSCTCPQTKSWEFSSPLQRTGQTGLLTLFSKNFSKFCFVCAFLYLQLCIRKGEGLSRDHSSSILTQHPKLEPRACTNPLNPPDLLWDHGKHEARDR